MAIQFARVEYVQRSQGQNACLKSSYNARSVLKDNRTGNVYYFENREEGFHHEILLPKGAALKFKDAAILWNAVEAFEKRSNAVLAAEEVVALPDDSIVSPELKVKLVREYVQQKYVDKGVAVQLDIHSPHDGSDKNWHAHILRATRRFNETGDSFCSHKARDLDNEMRHGRVYDGIRHGDLWSEFQNSFYEKYGIRDNQGNILKVDPLGIIPQEHLGPRRMRNIENDALRRAQTIQYSNETLSRDPEVILDHLMKTRSIFDEATLDWFLEKHVLENEREEIREGVLGHKDLLKLYDPEKEVTLYTTKSVREEETRLLRFAESIDSKRTDPILSTLASSRKTTELEVLKEGDALTEGQREAFEAVLKEGRGLHIIRGRAGAGKSTVLSPIRQAYEEAGYHVIGLAPTHRATLHLSTLGFRSSMTAHKFVFAAQNGRLNLPSQSLIVVDEAGMIGTEHFVELLNVARKAGSKVLLIGDEKQLESVQRGGMFEELSNRFGSTFIHGIQRQKDGWQKEVATCLAQGQWREAARILQDEKKIQWSETKPDALASLLNDWAKDTRLSLKAGQGLGNRFILATRNKDVDTLNMAARSLMKEWGLIEKEDFEIQTDRGRFQFSVGDRVLLNESKFGVISGDFATIKSLNETEITLALERGGEVSFDPGLYKGLRYGLVGTVYKSQGATLEKTYVLHDKVTRSKNSYVALTRHTQDIGIYINRTETRSLDHYIRQVSGDEGRSASICYQTYEEVQRGEEDLTFKSKVFDVLKTFKTKIGDTFYQNKAFYNLGEKKEDLRHEVTKVDLTATLTSEDFSDNKTITEIIAEKSQTLVPEDYLGKVSSHKHPNTSYAEIRDRLSLDVEGYARSLLGHETQKLSRGREMVWDQKGSKISLNRKTGQWQDFKTGEKGDLISLTSYMRGGSREDAYEQAKGYLGILEGIEKASFKEEFSKKLTQRQVTLEKEEQEERTRSQEKVAALVERSQPIGGTIAERYLREVRGIEMAELEDNLRYLPVSKTSEGGVRYPALLSLARNQDGTITACQITYLNEKTSKKAEIDVPKRTYGKVSYSFVEIQKGGLNTPLYVAEGVETALSLRESGLHGTIVAGLGLHNLGKVEESLRNSSALVIVADNDGEGSQSLAHIQKIKATYLDKGISCSIVMPTEQKTDFNDLLKNEGREEVFRTIQEQLKEQKLEVHKSDPNSSLESFNETSEREYSLKEGKEDERSKTLEYEVVSSKLTSKAREHKEEIIPSKDLSKKLEKDSGDIRSEYGKILRKAFLKLYGKQGVQKHEERMEKILDQVTEDHKVAVLLGKEVKNKSQEIGRVIHEHATSKEMEKTYLKKGCDENWSDWGRYHRAILRLSSLKGRLFKENEYEDSPHLIEKAGEIFGNDRKELEKEVKLLQKQGFGKIEAKLFCEMKMLFRERYGVEMPNSLQEQLRDVSKEGGESFNRFYSFKSGLTVSKQEKDGFKNEAYHLAFQESLFKIKATIRTGSIPSVEALKTHIRVVEKDYAACNRKYEHQYEKQQALGREQSQRHLTQKERGGFER